VLTVSTTVQMRQRGAITVPRELRRKYAFQEGDVFTLVDLGDGVLMLAPGASRVASLSRELSSSLSEGGISLEEMLQALDEERERYYHEHYVQPRTLPGQ